MKRQTLKPKEKPLQRISDVIKSGEPAAIARILRTPNTHAAAELYRRIAQSQDEEEQTALAGGHRGGQDDEH